MQMPGHVDVALVCRLHTSRDLTRRVTLLAGTRRHLDGDSLPVSDHAVRTDH